MFSDSLAPPQPSHSFHSQPPHHRPHGMSVEDRMLALRLQRDEESRVSEEAIRVGLTQQFAKAAGRSVDQVDLSALTLEEAEQAVQIQLRIKADKKKRGMLGGLKARFKLGSKQQTAVHHVTRHSQQRQRQLLVGGWRSGWEEDSGRRAEGGRAGGREQMDDGTPEAGVGDVGEQAKVKAKEKRDFFARIRGSNKQRPPVPSPPLAPLSSLPVATRVTSSRRWQE